MTKGTKQGTMGQDRLKSPEGKFDHYSATSELKGLACHPVDLTKKELLTKERIEEYSVTALGFRLCYAMERVDDTVLAALGRLALESAAASQMERMQAGEVLNRIKGFSSENRPVLHTAMRNLFGTPSLSKEAGKATELANQEVDKLELFNSQVFGTEQYTDMVAIGIGGSDLGPKAIYQGLQRFGKLNRRVHFVSNVDPDDIADVLSKVSLKKTLVVVISKSGTTLETLTNEQIIRGRYVRAGLDPKEHFIAVTGKASPMDDPEQYRETFYIWDYVGGRFSSTSMVGGVMLTFGLGFQLFRQLCQGAHDMDRHALEKDPLQNLPLLSALLGIWNRNFLHCPTVAIIPYSEALARFPAHLQQLDMESNGKQIDRQGMHCGFSTGPVVWGEAGTNSQHSFFQLLHQGTETIPVEFIGFKMSQYEEDLQVQGTFSQQKLLANLFAQGLALAEGQKSENPNQNFPGNRPSRFLLANQLTPYTMGALLAYYEHKTAFQGFIWDINSFDQEGVQLGKVLASQLLDLSSGKANSTDFPVGQSLLSLFEGL